jgi:DNA-binding transcriptional ArsR family regulator
MSDVNEHVSGPEALKAFAHPLRMAIYDYLTVHGSATATQVGKHLGESSGQTSYHLRQLARHGIVEDDPEHSGGRERWWRPVSVRFEAADLFSPESGAETVGAVMQGLLADRARVISAWAEGPDPDLAWRGAAEMSRATKELTADETRALIDELEQVVRRHLREAGERRDRGETEGRRQVRLYLDVLPVRDAFGPATGVEA